MNTQNKNTQGEETEAQASVFTVYHIAIPHQEEIWQTWLPEINQFLPKVGVLFLEFTTILSNDERERIEQHFNELAQGCASPYFHSADFLRPTLSWTTIEEFIHNTGKKIFLEKMPASAAESYYRHNKALREKVELFFKRQYREAGRKYQEAMELQMKEIEIRDAAICRQLDAIVERERGDVLVILGEDHSPFSTKAEIVRWEPKKYRNLAREIHEAVRTLSEQELEELLLRRIGMFWVEGYWEQSGEAGIEAIERAIHILDSVPVPRLKEMYDYITEGKREDAFFRAILWLKRHGFIKVELV